MNRITYWMHVLGIVVLMAPCIVRTPPIPLQSCIDDKGHQKPECIKLETCDSLNAFCVQFNKTGPEDVTYIGSNPSINITVFHPAELEIAIENIAGWRHSGQIFHGTQFVENAISPYQEWTVTYDRGEQDGRHFITAEITVQNYKYTDEVQTYLTILVNATTTLYTPRKTWFPNPTPTQAPPTPSSSSGEGSSPTPQSPTKGSVPPTTSPNDVILKGSIKINQGLLWYVAVVVTFIFICMSRKIIFRCYNKLRRHGSYNVDNSGISQHQELRDHYFRGSLPTSNDGGIVEEPSSSHMHPHIATPLCFQDLKLMHLERNNQSRGNNHNNTANDEEEPNSADALIRPNPEDGNNHK